MWKMVKMWKGRISDSIMEELKDRRRTETDALVVGNECFYVVRNDFCEKKNIFFDNSWSSIIHGSCSSITIRSTILIRLIVQIQIRITIYKGEMEIISSNNMFQNVVVVLHTSFSVIHSKSENF